MKTARPAVKPVLAVGDTVRVAGPRRTGTPATYTVTAVEYVERGGSRFDFYLIRRDADGYTPDRRYTRSDLVYVEV